LCADDSVLKDIKLGWQSAIAASQKYTTFEKTCRTELPNGSTDLPPGSVYTARWLVKKQGSKFVVGASNHGTDRDAKQIASALRVFDGNHEFDARVAEAVEREFSRQQPWIMSNIKQIGSSAHQLPTSHRNLAEVGLVFGNSIVCLSYLFPDNEHIQVDTLTSQSEDGRRIWRLEWSIIPEKKPKDLRTPGITKGILWLDPAKSFLPVRSEIGDPGSWWIKDKFTYRASLDSFYCEKTETDYELVIDGKTFTCFVKTQLTALSDSPVLDDVFTFEYYGLTEPEIVGPSRFPWYLIIIGLLVVVGAVIAKRYVKRSE